jgi:hypothetical protein
MSDPPDKVAAPIFGGILIIMGVLFLLSAVFKVFSLAHLWPLFMLTPVPFMAIALFRSKAKGRFGVFIPFTIIVYLVAYFLWLNYNPLGWSAVRTTWPHFIMAPGAAFLVTYLFTAEIGLLIPATILVMLSVIFFGVVQQNKVLIGVMIIVFGLIIIVRSIVKFIQQKNTIPPYK